MLLRPELTSGGHALIIPHLQGSHVPDCFALLSPFSGRLKRL